MAEQKIRFDDGQAYEQSMGVGVASPERFSSTGSHLLPIFVGLTLAAAAELSPSSSCSFALRKRSRESTLLTASSRLANARGGHTAEFCQGDAMALPFPAQTFDTAVMALVLTFVPDPARGVAEMARVVRPGGTVAAYMWDMLGGGFPWIGCWRHAGDGPLPSSPAHGRVATDHDARVMDQCGAGRCQDAGADGYALVRRL